MWGLIGLLLFLFVLPALAAENHALFQPVDLGRLADVGEPDLSGDGKSIVYSVSTSNPDEDLLQSDLWRVDENGSNREQLTHTSKSSEWRPRWSQDSKTIAFLSDRPAETSEAPDSASTQVWMLPATGGEARRVTDFADGVEDFAWSPDGRRLAVIAIDPEFPPGAEPPRYPPPIVTERYQFKDDELGYLGSRRKHLYLVDVASGKTELLTPGAHDEQLPAWSPDGKTLAYVTKRGADPDRSLDFDIYLVDARSGATERQLTTFRGADLDPYWETYPAWSPDGSRIAYLQSADDRMIYYAPWQLAVIDVDSGKVTRPAMIDRCVTKARWAPDGKSLLALIEQSRVTHLSRIDLATGTVTELTHGNRFDADFDIAANGRIVVLGGDDRHPYALSVVEGRTLRGLGDHNAWLDSLSLADAEPIRFTGADGTRLEGILVKPVGYERGTRYPTVVRLHGGPVYQFSHEFMADWQVYAANGFAVVGINPRGSSGRGFDYARAIRADWGNLDSRDVLAGVDYVVGAGIADPDRLGVGGWSYGAILTNAVIASDTRFKAAISGAGASNMLALYGHDQYVREYTLELGTPWANRDLYERVSFPFLHADRISTPTLFQCAEKDFNVPCLGAEQMYQALRALNVPTQLVIYPGQHHGLKVPSYLRDRMQRNLAWYQRFLSP